MKNDETLSFVPKWNSDGLIPAVAVDDETGAVLMMAWMNEDALRITLETGEAHYWSRSRAELWHKGATSGHVQHVRDVQIDCDQDTVLLRVQQVGAACHTGRRSCFYRRLTLDKKAGQIKLIFTEDG